MNGAGDVHGIRAGPRPPRTSWTMLLFAVAVPETKSPPSCDRGVDVEFPALGAVRGVLLRPGEVEDTGWRVEKLSGVLQRLRDASPGVAGRPRLIAVDGRRGAGNDAFRMQGDLDEQERRLIARDGNSAGQQPHVAEWLAEELPLLLRDQP